MSTKNKSSHISAGVRASESVSKGMTHFEGGGSSVTVAESARSFAGGSASESVSKGMTQAHTSSHLRPAGALGTDCGPATVSVTEGVSNTIAKDAATGEVTKAETRFATESFTVKPSEATQSCPAGTYADTKETTLTQVDGGPTRVSMSHSKIHTDQAGNVRSQTQSVSGGDYDAVQKGEASIGERVGSNERGAFAAAGSRALQQEGRSESVSNTKHSTFSGSILDGSAKINPGNQQGYQGSLKDLMEGKARMEPGNQKGFEGSFKDLMEGRATMDPGNQQGIGASLKDLEKHGAQVSSKDLSESISAVVAKLSPEQANKVAEMMAQSKSEQLGAFSNEAGSQSESMSIDKSQQATAQEQSRQSPEQGGQSREGKAEKQAEMEMDMGGM